jgi:hypothetical protein
MHQAQPERPYLCDEITSGQIGEVDPIVGAGAWIPWNHPVVTRRPTAVPAASKAVACLLLTFVIGGCASGAALPLDDPTTSGSTPAHGSLTDAQFNVAIAVARAETDPNAGPPCTSGTLLHIKLIGTFPTKVADLAGGEPISAELITADPKSGKTCLISVQTGATTPDAGATLLFTN